MLRNYNNMKKTKICIIGGGLAGLTAAAALSTSKVQIDLYSDKPYKNAKDERVTAISYSNLEKLKKFFNKRSGKIFYESNEINLFYENPPKLVNFLNFKKKKNAPIYIFKNEIFKKHLLIYLKNKKVKFFYKKIKNVDISKSTIEINKKNYSYNIIILCIGRNSNLYNKVFFKNKPIIKNYSQVAITGKVLHKKNKFNASQSFLKKGPLAILPYNDQSFSFVWTLNKKNFDLSTFKIDLKEKIKKILTKKIDYKIINIKQYPIKLFLSSQYYKGNILSLGEGLNSIHPIAGQGFNLVLRDIFALSNLVIRNTSLGISVNNSTLFDEFKNIRKSENILTGLAIDMVNTFFKKNLFFDPFKYKILDVIGKNKKIQEYSSKISDRGLLNSILF